MGGGVRSGGREERGDANSARYATTGVGIRNERDGYTIREIAERKGAQAQVEEAQDGVADDKQDAVGVSGVGDFGRIESKRRRMEVFDGGEV